MLPDQSAWLQYPIVAVIVLAGAVIALGFYRLFRDLISFMEKQDASRAIERETQRKWQDEQEVKRDERWQGFLKSMQDEWIKQDGRNNETLKDLIEKVDELIALVRNHDVDTKQGMAVMRERTGNTGALRSREQ